MDGSTRQIGGLQYVFSIVLGCIWDDNDQFDKHIVQMARLTTNQNVTWGNLMSQECNFGILQVFCYKQLHFDLRPRRTKQSLNCWHYHQEVLKTLQGFPLESTHGSDLLAASSRFRWRFVGMPSAAPVQKLDQTSGSWFPNCFAFCSIGHKMEHGANIVVMQHL